MRAVPRSSPIPVLAERWASRNSTTEARARDTGPDRAEVASLLGLVALAALVPPAVVTAFVAGFGLGPTAPAALAATYMAVAAVMVATFIAAVTVSEWLDDQDVPRSLKRTVASLPTPVAIVAGTAAAIVVPAVLD